MRFLKALPFAMGGLICGLICGGETTGVTIFFISGSTFLDDLIGFFSLFIFFFGGSPMSTLADSCFGLTNLLQHISIFILVTAHYFELMLIP